MKFFSLLFVIFFASFTEVSANDAVVRRFEIITKIFSKRVDANKPEILPPYDGPEEMLRQRLAQWFRRQIEIENVSYDVRETDSTVSPYSGEIKYSAIVRGRKGNSEKDVREGDENFKAFGKPCKARYDFQSSHWVLKSVSCRALEDEWETAGPEGAVYWAEFLPDE